MSNEFDPVRYRLLSAGMKCTDELVAKIYKTGWAFEVADTLVKMQPYMTAEQAVIAMQQVIDAYKKPGLLEDKNRRAMSRNVEG